MTGHSNPELYEKNLAALRMFAPQVHAEVRRLTSFHCSLVEQEDGDWNIEFRGTKLYAEGARKDAEKYTDERHRWVRVGINTPKQKNLDEYSASMFVPMLRRAVEADISFFNDPTDSAGHYLVSYGVGLGLHLPGLIEFTSCRTLILVEPNPEFLSLSLHVFDWAEFLEGLRDRRISVAWVTADRDILITNNVRNIMRFFNPTRLDGSYLFFLYPNAHMAASHKMLMDEAGVILSGLGWLDDEIIMVRNSHANLRDGQALIFRRSDEPVDWPAFIVGSGPSIDNDLDAIAAQADRAIIFACGTGLGPLLRRGIRPDFYVELENFPQSFTFLDSVVQKYSLEGITLIGTTTIDPRIPPMFDRQVLFLRDGLASFPVFCRDGATELPHVNPTVTNTGLAYALASGFREFYFFGIDLGAKDPARHHSKDTPYYQGVLPCDQKLTDPLPGNFGGTVYTDSVFRWAHDAFEKLIALRNMGCRYYNCSDGALIKGATPKVAASIKLPPRARTKAQLIDALLAKYRPYGKDTFNEAWNREEHLASLATFRDQLLEFLDKR
ncbi:MAG: 6-hydroxymethylpterin diphosphokinase MptE-like protein, partial [Candidatus Zixiibacteriota bacterium]